MLTEIAGQPQHPDASIVRLQLQKPVPLRRR
jgi:hypothetical protein